MSGYEQVAGVCIGIDHYPHADPKSQGPSLNCRALSFAAADAECMYELWMSHRPNTDLELLVNADGTTKRVKKAILDAARKADNSNGTLLITYSGHGIRVARGTKRRGGRTWRYFEAFCLTHDVNSYQSIANQDETQSGGFSVNMIRSWLRDAELSPPKIIILLDCCASGGAIPSSTVEETGHLPKGKDLTSDSSSAVIPRFVEVKGGPPEPPTDHFEVFRIWGGIDADWPIGSRVVVVSATTGAELAHEDPRLRHGIFTHLTLEWLETSFFARKGGSNDFGGSLKFHLDQGMRRLKRAGLVRNSRLQKADYSNTGAIALDEASDESRLPVAASRLSHILAAPPVPDYPNPRAQETIDIAAQNLTRIKRRLKPSHDEPISNTNLVVQAPMLSNPWSWTALATREAVAESFSHETSPSESPRPVIDLGVGYPRGVVPFLRAISTITNSHLAVHRNSTRVPLIQNSEDQLIDDFLEVMKSRRGIVISPHLPPDEQPLIKRFLDGCANTNQIHLVTVLHTDESIPRRIRETHYREVEFEIPSFQHYQRFCQAKLLKVTSKTGLSNDEYESGLPREMVSWPLLNWLARLGQSGDETLTDRQILPWTENRNGLRLLLNVLEDVLAKLAESHPECLSLLKLMGAMTSPLDRQILETGWNLMKEDEDLKSDIEFDAALNTLKDWHLVFEQIEGYNTFPNSFGKPVYFLHSVVRRAVKENVVWHSDDKFSEWSELAGETYWKHLQTCDKDYIKIDLIRAIFAHEAIERFREANEYESAADVLLECWDELIDGGYQDDVLKWVEWLRMRLTPVPGLADSKKHLIRLVGLLVKLQTLLKHCQKWSQVELIHQEIDQRTKRLRSGEDDDAKKLDALFLKSRLHAATMQFVRKNFSEAKKHFDAIASQPPSGDVPSIGDRDMQCRCLIRIAHCHAMTGQLFECKKAISDANNAIDVLEQTGDPSAMVAKHRRHLRSVKMDLMRFSENSDDLYQLARDAWTESLKELANGATGYRFNHVIARSNLAWACLFRGEPYRAVQHCVQARATLNDRGIAEYWWYAEIERIIGLANAIYFREVDAFKTYQPWYSLPARTTTLHNLMRSDLDEHLKNLDDLIRACDLDNPWRTAELLSAKAQVLHASEPNRDNASVAKLLEMALDIAEKYDHFVLQTYIHEIKSDYTAALDKAIERGFGPGWNNRRETNADSVVHASGNSKHD